MRRKMVLAMALFSMTILSILPYGVVAGLSWGQRPDGRTEPPPLVRTRRPPTATNRAPPVPATLDEVQRELRKLLIEHGRYADVYDPRPLDYDQELLKNHRRLNRVESVTADECKLSYVVKRRLENERAHEVRELADRTVDVDFSRVTHTPSVQGSWLFCSGGEIDRIRNETFELRFDGSSKREYRFFFNTDEACQRAGRLVIKAVELCRNR